MSAQPNAEDDPDVDPDEGRRVLDGSRARGERFDEQLNARDREAALRAADPDGAEGTERDERCEGAIRLIPLGSPDLPRLVSGNLPAWAGDYALALSAATETPIELAAAMVLAACSAACARRLRVCVTEGHYEPVNLWLIAAMPSGNRKSAVQAGATRPIVAWERARTEEMDPEIKRATSERKVLEARAKELRSKAARTENKAKLASLIKEAGDIEVGLEDTPTTPQIWTSDATPERVGALLADNHECMAWLSSEGGIFDLMLGRYSSGIPNMDLMLKCHGGDSERVDRGSRPPVYLRCPRLTIGLSPQPDVLRGLAFKPGFRGRGLLARFGYLLPPSSLGYRSLRPAPVSPAVASAYEKGVHNMLNWAPALDEHGAEKPYELRLSREAYSEWLAFAHRIERRMRPGEDMENLTDWAGKAPGIAARLAGVLHGIEHSDGKPWACAITKSTMSDALDIMVVIVKHSIAAMDLMGADPTVAAAHHVWEWVERNRHESFTVSQAHHALRGTFPRVKGLREALAVLEERGYLEVTEPEPTGKRGRPPSPNVLVSAQIREGWK